MSDHFYQSQAPFLVLSGTKFFSTGFYNFSRAHVKIRSQIQGFFPEQEKARAQFFGLTTTSHTVKAF